MRTSFEIVRGMQLIHIQTLSIWTVEWVGTYEVSLSHSTIPEFFVFYKSELNKFRPVLQEN